MTANEKKKDYCFFERSYFTWPLILVKSPPWLNTSICIVSLANNEKLGAW